MDFQFNNIRLNWNFQGWMVLVRNSFSKNLSSIHHIRPEFQFIYSPCMASRGIFITTSLQELQSSGWFQIIANICGQFLSERNFKIRFHSFFTTILASIMLKLAEKAISPIVNSTFLSPRIKYKKSARTKVYAHSDL